MMSARALVLALVSGCAMLGSCNASLQEDAAPHEPADAAADVGDATSADAAGTADAASADAGTADAASADAAGTADAADATDATVDAQPFFEPCPGAQDPGPTGIAADDLVRTAYVDTTEVLVGFCNPLIANPPNELLFYVELTDHSGLPPSYILSGSSLTTANLKSDGPFTWDGDDLTSTYGDHHEKGHLHAPKTTAGGKPLVTSDAGYLQLTIAGIGTYDPITVQWDQKYLQ